MTTGAVPWGQSSAQVGDAAVPAAPSRPLSSRAVRSPHPVPFCPLLSPRRPSPSPLVLPSPVPPEEPFAPFAAHHMEVVPGGAVPAHGAHLRLLGDVGDTGAALSPGAVRVRGAGQGHGWGRGRGRQGVVMEGPRPQGDPAGTAPAGRRVTLSCCDARPCPGAASPPCPLKASSSHRPHRLSHGEKEPSATWAAVPAVTAVLASPKSPLLGACHRSTIVPSVAPWTLNFELELRGGGDGWHVGMGRGWC